MSIVGLMSAVTKDAPWVEGLLREMDEPPRVPLSGRWFPSQDTTDNDGDRPPKKKKVKGTALMVYRQDHPTHGFPPVQWAVGPTSSFGYNEADEGHWITVNRRHIGGIRNQYGDHT